MNAYPLIALPGDLRTEAANAACHFAQSQPPGTRLLLFNFGQANVQGGEFGAGREDFYSNDEIRAALEAAALSYRQPSCYTPGTSATIAYGVGNFGFSSTGNEGGPISPQLAGELGAAQLEVALSLRNTVAPEDGVAVAGDIEPGWDPSGLKAATALVRGAATGDLTYYNFGSAGNCPPYSGGNPGCGAWTFRQLGTLSQAHMAVPLPQIYHAYQAKQWARVRRTWDGPRASECSLNWDPLTCYGFAGATSEPKPCGASVGASQSWRKLWRINPLGSVGPELIYYNPNELYCDRRDMRGGYRLLSQIEPAHIVGNPDPVVPAHVLNPVVNEWRAGDRRGITLVQAGRAGDDPDTGRVVVFRERQRPFAQWVDVVDVPGAGKLRIARAPSGRAAARAPLIGTTLRFRGSRGARGTLRLTRDGATIAHP